MKTRPEDIKRVVKADLIAAHAERDWKTKRELVLRELPDSPFLPPQVLAGLIRITEGICIALVAFATLAYHPGLALAKPVWFYDSIILFAALVIPALFQVGGLYRLDALLNPLRFIPGMVLVWVIMAACVAVTVLIAQLGMNISRVWFITWGISGLFFLVSVRFMIADFVRYLNRNGQFNRRAVLVGGGEAADHVIAVLENSKDTGLNLVGIFDDRHDARAPDETRGLHMLGSTDDLIDFVRKTRIDTFIITLPVTAEDRLLSILKRLWVLPVDIRVSAHGQKLRYRPRAYSYIGNLPLLDLFDRPMGDWGPFLKTAEDRIIASLALILAAPLFLLIAIAIKLESKGPVFFRQKRYGFNNELIEIYKFRSMYTDKTDADATKLVTRGDPRVTRVGRFLRKSSLDELPQFLNVLKGDLSLVGPRPHATKASADGNLYETVVEGYFARHKVKPGITGWAQVNGWRGETDTREKIERRVEHDLYYIENWSLTFDLYILARTPLALLKTDQAY